MHLCDLSDELILSERGPLSRIELNRPESLNALSLDMIRLMSAAMRQWKERDSVRAIVFTGAGERAFCAGGDLKTVYHVGMAVRKDEAIDRVASVFFGEEYLLNLMIYESPKPTIALMHGYTMGGGFGIAGPCNYRIVCENTMFAMPEVAIGFFPDVGSAHFLSQCPGRLGLYLALTGERIGPADMIHCGLATHFVPLARRETLLEAIGKALADLPANKPAEAAIKKVLEDLSTSPPAGMLEKRRPEIDEAFAGGSPEEILDRLESQGSEWSADTAAKLRNRSPTSLKVVHRQMSSSRGLTFEQALERDFVLAQHFVRGHDFYEGVRALLIDKDSRPRWEPAELDQVDETLVQEHFQLTDLDLRVATR